MKEDSGYLIIESVKDLEKFKILFEERWREGVTRLHLVENKPYNDTFYLAFCNDKILAKYKAKGGGKKL